MPDGFQLVETPEQPVMSTRTVVSVENLPTVLGQTYGVIAEHLNKLGEQPADAPFVAYYNTDMQNLQIEIGLVVSKPLPGTDDIKPGWIPAGKKAIAWHKGPYHAVVSVYQAVGKWLDENGLKHTGVVYEYYYNSPVDVPESELLTKIMFLVE